MNAWYFRMLVNQKCDEFGCFCACIGAKHYAERLDKSDVSELDKLTKLYEYALSEQGRYTKGVPEWRVSVEVCRYLKGEINRSKAQMYELETPSCDFHRSRHGVKLGAYQWKHDESRLYKWGRDELKKSSKCWKDQRGKGRSKRSTQYRAVIM